MAADWQAELATALHTATLHLPPVPQAANFVEAKPAHKWLSNDPHCVHRHGTWTTPFSRAYSCMLQEAIHTCSHLVVINPVQHWTVTLFEAFSLALSVHQARAGQGSENQVTAPSGM